MRKGKKIKSKKKKVRITKKQKVCYYKNHELKKHLNIVLIRIYSLFLRFVGMFFLTLLITKDKQDIEQVQDDLDLKDEQKLNIWHLLQ